VTDRARSLNSHFNWDKFDSAWYAEHNYQCLRDDDQAIIDSVRDFFADAGVADAGGIDVGSGSNLYPALSLLPFCERLELWEYAATNVEWLTEQVNDYDASWDRFWTEFALNPAYSVVPDPRARLAEIAHVRQASVFDLPRRSWDIGTMFFVACSISTEISEFRRAVKIFVHSLRPSSPFAIAFMVDSQGYYVGDTWFPAVPVGLAEINRSLSGIAYDVNIQSIDTGSPLREGYGGMALATGRAAG
jgi:hypothetical protein